MSNTTDNNELRQDLEKMSYTKEAKEAAVANLPNFYVIPKAELEAYITQAANKAAEAAIPKFSDMPAGNADFMEGFRAACLQMEAALTTEKEGADNE